VDRLTAALPPPRSPTETDACIRAIAEAVRKFDNIYVLASTTRDKQLLEGLLRGRVHLKRRVLRICGHIHPPDCFILCRPFGPRFESVIRENDQCIGVWYLHTVSTALHRVHGALEQKFRK
jgi:hypothetical protein